MNFDLSGEQRVIVDEVQKTCRAFDENYWRKNDAEALFPHAFHKAMAEAGWLGIAMPEAQGGAGLGITEAALMLQAVSASGRQLETVTTMFSMVARFGSQQPKWQIRC